MRGGIAELTSEGVTRSDGHSIKQEPQGTDGFRRELLLAALLEREVLSVAFAIECHDRAAFAWTASPHPLSGAALRTLMDEALWARFGEASLKARTRFNSSPTTAATVLYAHELGNLNASGHDR